MEILYTMTSSVVYEGASKGGSELRKVHILTCRHTRLTHCDMSIPTISLWKLFESDILRNLLYFYCTFIITLIIFFFTGLMTVRVWKSGARPSCMRLDLHISNWTVMMCCWIWLIQQNSTGKSHFKAWQSSSYAKDAYIRAFTFKKWKMRHFEILWKCPICGCLAKVSEYYYCFV